MGEVKVLGFPTKTRYDLIIDPEFFALLKSCGKEQNESLEVDLIANGGPREPLIIWQEEGILIGGHRRYAICEANNLPYQFELKSFPDRLAVMEWMILDQEQRRNQSSHDKAMARNALVKLRMAQKEVDEVVAPSEKVAARANAVKEVAEESGVDPRTVNRSVEYGEAFDSLNGPVQEKIAMGDVKCSREAVQILAGMSAKDQEKLCNHTAMGKYQSIDHALRATAPKTKKPAKAIGNGKPKKVDAATAKALRDAPDAAPVEAVPKPTKAKKKPPRAIAEVEDPVPEPEVAPEPPEVAPEPEEVAPEPPKKKRRATISQRASEDSWAYSLRQMALLKATVGDLGNQFPSAQYQLILDSLDRMSSLLASWKETESE